MKLMKVRTELQAIKVGAKWPRKTKTSPMKGLRRTYFDGGPWRGETLWFPAHIKRTMVPPCVGKKCIYVRTSAAIMTSLGKRKRK